MARYVIFIRLSRNPLIRTIGEGYDWEVRPLTGDAADGDLAERSGPVLASGHAADLVTAKHDAETIAEALALEETYIYNTNQHNPTPLPESPLP